MSPTCTLETPWELPSAAAAAGGELSAAATAVSSGGAPREHCARSAASARPRPCDSRPSAGTPRWKRPVWGLSGHLAVRLKSPYSACNHAIGQCTCMIYLKETGVGVVGACRGRLHHRAPPDVGGLQPAGRPMEPVVRPSKPFVVHSGPRAALGGGDDLRVAVQHVITVVIGRG